MNDKLILTIIDKFSSGSIGELDIDDGTTRLTLKKERAEPSPRKTSPAADGPAADTADPVSGGTQGETSVRLGISANAAEAPGGEKITSPIVATFYSSPSPDSPPFVAPGDKVNAGQTLCILEAMKMMNHLEAEFDCEIIGTHAASGDLVEYGQTLFTVKRL